MIVTPAPRGSRSGNRRTAERWAGLLRALGHRVRVAERWNGQACGLLVALHARKSYASVRAFRRAFPRRPIVVALTGTDLYRDLPRSRAARQSLRLADRLVVLQPLALRRLPPQQRSKARVIYQSVELVPRAARGAARAFDVCVLGHLRPLKDPFRAAMAARGLPARSRIRILHAGGALRASMVRRAREEAARNPRYRWLGELSPAAARRLLARCRLLVHASRMEGGANVVGEAIRFGVPVLASRIPGNVGLLGPRYPGYFPPGNTAALRRLLARAEREPSYLEALRRAVRARQKLFTPARERAAWRRLLRELGCESRGHPALAFGHPGRPRRARGPQPP